MGQKVNPISMRLQVNKDWRSKWFANKREYAKYLAQDLATRKLIQNKVGSRGAINKVDIERSPNLVTVTINTGKAGVVIGRGGTGAQELKDEIEKIYGVGARVNIEEIKKLQQRNRRSPCHYRRQNGLGQFQTMAAGYSERIESFSAGQRLS